MPVQDRNVRWLLGVCGVGGAVAVPHHVLYLRERGIDVRVMTTPSALRFVTLDVLEAFSGRKVFTSVFDRGEGIVVPHVELPAQADILVVMPASADMIARLATGRADDLISACVLCSEMPVLVVPALNDVIRRKASVQRNLDTLVADGLHVMEPVEGPSIRVASAERQSNTMPSLSEVVRKAEGILFSFHQGANNDV